MFFLRGEGNSCFDSPGTRVVEPAPAMIGNGEWDGIPENHKNMTKFAAVQDAGFRKVSAVIKRWMRELGTNEEGEFLDKFCNGRDLTRDTATEGAHPTPSRNLNSSKTSGQVRDSS